MKAITVPLISILTIIIILGCLSTSYAQQNSITIPKGTTVQKIEAGHFKFTLPNKQIVEVKNFNLRVGAVGYIAIINPDPPDKPVVLAKRGTLVLSKILTKSQASKLSPTDYIQIDDEVTWLPLTITYIGPKFDINRDLNKLNPQPEPPIFKK